MAIVRVSRWSTLALSIAFGCAHYHPMPLDSARSAGTTAALESQWVRVRARELKHPILQPIELNLSHGLTPDQAAVLAVILNPALCAARDQRAMGAAQVLAAGILPNPQLTFNEDLPNGGADATSINDYGIGLNWDVTQLITHDAKVRAARSGAASIQLDIAWQEWQVAQAAKTALYDLIALRQQLDLTRDVDRRLGENVGSASRRVLPGMRRRWSTSPPPRRPVRMPTLRYSRASAICAINGFC